MGSPLGHCIEFDTMKPHILILLFCTAGLVTILWPKEVMSPAKVEVALTAEDSGEERGELMDLSSLVVEPQRGTLRGGDHASLTRQGEILAHDPIVMEQYLASLELHSGRKRFLVTCAHLALEQREASEEVWRTISPSDPVSSVERATVSRLLSGEKNGVAVLASSEDANAIVRGLEMASMKAELRRALRARDHPAACGILSNLLELELTADWDPHLEVLCGWAKKLNDSQGFHRWNKGGEWSFLEYEVQPGDSLVAIRKRLVKERPGLNICTGLIARANQLRDENSIQPKEKLRIPLDPVHVLVDLSARFLLYYHGDEVVCAWPVTIGREGKTIPGHYKVGQKKAEPMWFPQGQRPVPFGEPENPLGTRWIAWEGSNGLGFHGTSEDDQIGEEASDGCIRLWNWAVEELFEILPMGSDIRVQP